VKCRILQRGNYSLKQVVRGELAEMEDEHRKNLYMAINLYLKLLPYLCRLSHPKKLEKEK
jgi:hypothetical protein